MPWRALRAALGAGVATLAFAGAANANVIVISGDNGSGTDNLTAAINQANTNTATSNTIVLEPGVYQPKTQPITITKTLTITGDHSFQTPVGNTPQIEINGSTADLAAANNLLVVNHGVTLTMNALNFDNVGAAGFFGILDNGNVIWNGVESTGAFGGALDVTQIGTATLNESGISSALQDSILNAGSLTMNNSQIDQGSVNGIDNQAPYTLNLNNTLLAFQGGGECNGGGATNGGPGSLSDDATCGVQYNSDTAVDSYFPIPSQANGGPTTSVELPAGNPDTTGKGVAPCPTTDQRFFVIPAGSGCNIGSITNTATQQTTGPSCAVTGVTAGPPKQQTVALQDTQSGVGPQPGPATDNPSNTTATAYPPPAAVPVFSYAVDNLQISNGTVAFTPFTTPSTSPLVLTASKTTAGTTTQWSFTGANWAGVSKNCF